MHTVELFRHKLIHRLIHCAADRRQACAEVPTGEDLKIIALFDRLARDAEQIDAEVSTDVGRALADPVKARGLRQILEDLPAAIGFSVWPKDAVDLIRWMLVQASPPDPGPSRQPTDFRVYSPEKPAISEVFMLRNLRSGPVEARTNGSASRRSRIASQRAGTASERRSSASARRPVGEARPDMFRSFARDFTGGLSVVGPIIAVWELARGFRQWRDRAFAASHPTTTATILAVKTEPATRSFRPPVTGTISFQPSAGYPLCTMPIRLDAHAGSFEPGQSLAVVPKSGDCEVPLVPAQIGDPTASFVCAILFLVAGVAALKAWLWLSTTARPSELRENVRSAATHIAL